jgi:hypothetical protein
MDAFAFLVGTLLITGLALGVAIHLANGGGPWSRSRSATWREAQERAETLLREMLTVEEYDQLSERGYLDVPSPSQPARTYRVPLKGGRVAIVEGGAEVESLCVGPVESVPPGDVILIHKLMIEGDEQEYLRRANRYRLRVPASLLGVGG